MARFKINFLLLLLLVIAHTNAKEEVNYTELAAGQELKKEKIEGEGIYKFYKFQVEDGFKGDKDITIKTALTEEHPWSNPDIYLAKESKTPNITQHQIGT